MNKDKRANTVILCIALVCAIAIIVFFMINKKATLKEPNVITNFKETEVGTLPDFGVIIGGSYEGAIVNSDVEKMKAYEFDATFFNGWEVKKNHYVGIRVKDAFETINVSDYAQVKFKSYGMESVIYEAADITDNTFFIIKRDGEFINDDVFAVMSFDKDYNYMIENLLSVYIYKEGN